VETEYSKVAANRQAQKTLAEAPSNSEVKRSTSEYETIEQPARVLGMPHWLVPKAEVSSCES
jgi:hypothetical protein